MWVALYSRECLYRSTKIPDEKEAIANGVSNGRLSAYYRPKGRN